MKKIFLYAIVLLLLGCTEDNTPEPSNTPEPIDIPDPSDTPDSTDTSGLYLKRVTDNGNTASTYEYNDAKELVLATFYRPDQSISHQHKYTYSDKTIVKEVLNDAGKVLSSYSFYPIHYLESREDEFDANGKLYRYRRYIFSSRDNCGVTTVKSYNSIGGLLGTNSIKYIDDNCSYESLVEDIDGNFVRKIRVVKDGKKNSHEYASRHNFYTRVVAGNTLETMELDSIGNDINLWHKIVYEYNDTNYPITAQITTGDGIVSNLTYEYY